MKPYVMRLKDFFSRPFFSRYDTLFGLWCLLAFISWITKWLPHKYNNFLIYKSSFPHLLQQLPLYQPYPAEHHDVFLYGPFFTLLIAPFSCMPEWLGMLLWQTALAVVLFGAIKIFPFEDRSKIVLYWFCSHELLTALFLSQANILIVAFILLSFIFIEKEKDFWAVFFIMAGTFIKLYGVVGFAFFFFSHHKRKFIFSCFVWTLVMFALPMIFTNGAYIAATYKEWFASLVAKNGLNHFAGYQNISFLGMVRKISGNPDYSDLWLIIPGLVLFALPYLRFRQFAFPAFRQTMLASVLIFLVLFSTGSESSTYIIALVGVGIWYLAAPWKRSRLDLGLMIFVLILTSFSVSDLFPAFLRKELVRPYALKALPCLLVWLKLIGEMCRKTYASSENGRNIDNAPS